MKKILIIGFAIIMIGIAGFLMLRQRITNDVLVLHDDLVTTQTVSFAVGHDFKFSALYDPFAEFDPQLYHTVQKVRLDSALTQEYLVWVDVKNIVIGDQKASQLLDITVLCDDKPLFEHCLLSANQDQTLSITIDFQTYQLDEHWFDIEQHGLRFELMFTLYPKDTLTQTLQTAYQSSEDLLRVYTEFGHDPSREMIINYHANHGPLGVIEYRELGTNIWQESLSESFVFPFKEERIYRTRLQNLTPDTTYEFQINDAHKTYRFKTMPLHLDREIKIVFTGDSRSFNDWFYDLNDVIYNQQPDLVVGTGDYVACEGILSAFNSNLWVHFLDALNDAWIDDDGLIIPFMPGFGNHEADSGWSGSLYRDKAYLPLLFSFPNQADYPREASGFGYIQFGDYFTLILLDSYHTNDIEPQTTWLLDMQSVFQETTHIVPVYHSAVFPSRKPFNVSYKNAIRHQWLPIFQELGVRVVMESCDHTYKKTFPIWFDDANPDGVIHPDGMIFLGDGGWGAPLRTVLLENEGQFDYDRISDTHWWIEDAAGLDHNIDNSKHIHMVTLRTHSIFIESINFLGTVFDAFEMDLND